VIEYDPEDVEAYIDVADAIEAAFPTVVVEGNESGDGRTGSFEVTTSDGVQIYSKLTSHRYPDPQDLIDRIVNRAKIAANTAAADGPACG